MQLAERPADVSRMAVVGTPSQLVPRQEVHDRGTCAVCRRSRCATTIGAPNARVPPSKATSRNCFGWPEASRLHVGRFDNTRDTCVLLAQVSTELRATLPFHLEFKRGEFGFDFWCL